MTRPRHFPMRFLPPSSKSQLVTSQMIRQVTKFIFIRSENTELILEFSFYFSDAFLSKLSKLYTSDNVIYFKADHPFLYHIWDHKLKTTILSGSLKEFEGKKCKRVMYFQKNNKNQCFYADGKEMPCRDF